MIRPPGFRGAAFTTAGHGDLRHGDRVAVSRVLGISPEWATVHQVHGDRILTVDEPGPAGEADAMVTTVAGLPVAIFTADCAAVVLEAAGAVGVAHGGWRGLAARVVAQLRERMEAAGHRVERAAVGPMIGPCCFEVGTEVREVFAPFHTVTTWATPSVDLRAAAREQLEGVDVWVAEACTRCDPGFHSHRRDGTVARMAGIGWVP